MFENRVKHRLGDGRAVWGASVPDASDIVAKLTIDCDVDFLWIDLEHRPYGTHEVRWIPILCRQAGCSSMIRVPGLDPNWIKKALDIGADTAMVPPAGSRGVSPLWTTFMNVDWQDYLPVANQETCVIVQIETAAGIENLDAIAAVEGVDIVFAGPADLAATMGVIGHPETPKVQQFLADFPARVEAHGKSAGITFNTLEEARRSWEQGYRFINVGTLVHHGIAGLKAGLEQLRALQ